MWLIALGLFAAGATGIVLAVTGGEWKFGFASGSVIVLALIYFIAAIRRRPL